MSSSTGPSAASKKATSAVVWTRSERYEAENVEIWEEHRIEPVRFVDGGERVVVIQHEYQRGKGSGVEVEIDTATVFDLRGGLILRIQPYMNPAAALEAVGLPEEAARGDA